MSIPLADGPAMYFGGTIMTFALPMGAFIVISVALFYLFRAGHSGPRLKYMTHAAFASLGTREPGSAPGPVVVAAGAPEPAVAETAAPEASADAEATEGKEGGEE